MPMPACTRGGVCRAVFDAGRWSRDRLTWAGRQRCPRRDRQGNTGLQSERVCCVEPEGLRGMVSLMASLMVSYCEPFGSRQLFSELFSVTLGLH